MQKKFTNQLWFKNPLLLLLTIFIFSLGNAYSQGTYYWVGGTSGEYSISTNWNTTLGGGGTSRNTPNTADILIFDLFNRGGGGGAGSVTCNNITNETIAQLQLIQSASPSARVVTFSGTATTLTISGNLTINTSCSLADGGNTINIGGNLASNASASGTFHTSLSTLPNTLSGRLVFTGASPVLFSSATGGNLGLGNVEISAASNVSINSSINLVVFNGNLNINTGGRLTQGAKGIALNATNGVGGTISGSGVIVGSAATNGILYVQGSGPVSGTQTVGTINFDNTSTATSTINGLQILRPNAITTIGTANNNTFTIAGGITLTAGTLNDGGNTIAVAGGTMITTANTTPGAAVYTGTGRINFTRANTSTSPYFFASTTTTTYISVGNITWSPASASTLGPAFNSSSTNNLAVTLTGAFNFVRNGAGSPTITLNSTVASLTVAPSGSITIPTGLTFDFNGRPVTLQSDATGTASISTITGVLNGASNVTVQRYIPSNGRRRYVLVTSPVTSTINAGWQEGGVNTNAGFGTFITNAQTTNGFDAPATSGASIFRYDDTKATTTKWTALTSTTIAASLAPGTGYLLFVRGDRSLDITNAPTASNNTTLRATGTIATGDITPTLYTTTANLFNLVANPYASAVKWSGANSVTKTNLATNFYVYDPNNQLFYTSDGTTVSPSPAGPVAVSQQQANIIQSGQAFFIQNAASGSPSITFTEASKTTGTTAITSTVFGEDATAKSQLNLNIYRTQGNVFADGVVALFGKNYSANVSMDEDALKFTNFNESFSLRRNDQPLSIEKRPSILGNDTLYFNLSNFGKRDYTFVIDGSNFTNTTATLEDKYTATKTPIDLTGNTMYKFTVNEEAASSANDRFIITFGSTANIATTVDATTNGSLFVKMSPNPVSNQLQVNFKTDKADQTTINIINSLGQIVKTVNAGKVDNGNISIPVTNLATGIYTVQLLSGDKQISSQKVIKE